MCIVRGIAVVVVLTVSGGIVEVDCAVVVGDAVFVVGTVEDDGVAVSWVAGAVIRSRAPRRRQPPS
jgi:hypothetical protein